MYAISALMTGVVQLQENSCSGESGAQKLPPKSQTPKNTSSEYFDIDDYDNEFTDTLFDSLSQPYMFPNPKEMGALPLCLLIWHL